MPRQIGNFGGLLPFFEGRTRYNRARTRVGVSGRRGGRRPSTRRPRRIRGAAGRFVR